MTHDQRILEILNNLSNNVATILEEQHSQRIDIRSLQRDVSGIKGKISGINDEISGINDEISGMKSEMSDMKDEISEIKAMMATKADLEQFRIELKSDIQDLRTEVTRTHKVHDKRLTNLEENIGIPDPTKH